jgi:hypothetical protein
MRSRRELKAAALDIASEMLGMIDRRSRAGLTAPLSVKMNAHCFGVVAERHNLSVEEMHATLKLIPWADRQVQKANPALLQLASLLKSAELED